MFGFRYWGRRVFGDRYWGRGTTVIVPAPPSERIAIVLVEIRTAEVPAESRVAYVAAEVRVATVPE